MGLPMILEVSTFCSVYGRRGPLLRPADLMAPYVHNAQRDLINELTRVLDDKGQISYERFKYGKFSGQDGGQTWDKMTVWERRLSKRPTFQIHRYKMLDDLTEFLLDQGLAWKPREEFWTGTTTWKCTLVWVRL